MIVFFDIAQQIASLPIRQAVGAQWACTFGSDRYFHGNVYWIVTRIFL